MCLAAALGALVSGCGGHLGSRDARGGPGGAAVAHGSGAGGEAGTDGSGRIAGSGGAGALDGEADGPPFGEPACPSTAGDGRVCTPSDLQLCYRPCGPESTGVKSETCQSSGLYTEMVGCSYDLSRDYSCYRIPPAPNIACGGETPQAGRPCDVPVCTLCNSLGGVVGGNYASGGGAITAGWCVCQEPGAAGVRTWSCANASQWPCPIGRGC